MQNRSGRYNSTFQRSFSSPRATVTNGNDRTPSFVGVYRNSSLREISSRPSLSRLTERQTSSASSSPSSTRRRDVTGCLATSQVRVTRTSSLSGAAGGGSVGRSATLPAAQRASMLPTATHFNVRPTVSDDKSASRTVVQQKLRVMNTFSLHESYMSFLGFTLNRFFMKLFKTNNIETVKECQKLFDFNLPSIQWTSGQIVVKKFEGRCGESHNLLLKLVAYENRSYICDMDDL